MCPWVFRWNSHKGAVLGKICLAFFVSLGKGEYIVLGSGVLGSKITDPFLQKSQRHAVHRMGVVGNRRRTCTDQEKHRST